MAITYKKAGVDIVQGDRFVDLLKPIARRTMRPEVLTGIGLFGALFKLDIKKYKDPVLVSSTDGVGTKLKLAFMANKHDSVGIDLVAMSVNDVLTTGADPLFFLDYFATGKLRPEKSIKVMEGIVKGCEESGCALIGGETAEMPGFYKNGEYDLAGFAVGAVNRSEIIDGKRIRKGDLLIGLSSSGLHSNGYSLVRKILIEKAKLPLRKKIPELGTSLISELLKPTRIYVKAVKALKGKVDIKGIAHITGGGIPGNLNRILPKDVDALLNESSWPVPPIFGLIQKLGDVPMQDMKKTFNMGIGYILVIPPQNAQKALKILKNAGYEACLIGKVQKGESAVTYCFSNR